MTEKKHPVNFDGMRNEFIELLHLDTEIKQLTARKSELANKIKEQLTPNEVPTIDGEVVGSIHVKTTTTIDTDTLASQYPEVYHAVTTKVDEEALKTNYRDIYNHVAVTIEGSTAFYPNYKNIAKVVPNDPWKR